jgi:hypothetical protein
MKIGQAVRTTKNAERTDWASPRVGVRWGALGVIIEAHDAHGEYYDVRHDDGSVASYDFDEIEAA